MDQTQEKITPLETLKLYWQATIKHRRDFLVSLLLPVGTTLFTVAVPFFAGKVLAGIAQQDQDLNMSLFLLAACSLSGLLFNRIGFAAACQSQAKAMSELNRLVFSRLLERSVGFHTNRVSGKLVTDALDFVGAYGDFMNASFINGLPFLLSVAAGLTIVMAVAWPLGLFLLLVVVTTLIWAYLATRRRAALRVHRLAASKRLTSHMADNIVNAQTVKTFSREQRELSQSRKLGQDLETLRIRDWQTIGRSGNNRMGALLLMQFAMVIFIIHLTRSDPSMLGAGIFAFTYTFMLTTRLFDINGYVRIIDESFLKAAPMTNVLQESAEIKDVPGASQLEVTHGAIKLHDLHFAYPEDAQNGAVFSGLNLDVKPGEKIGLVGPSGGGKSTLTRLLLRFDDLQDGSISIDGQNIAETTQTSLRENIAYVPQEPLLFHRSIGDNIGYGRAEAKQADVVKAARKAKADEFIARLANGYDTIVGERGVKLSGGQRQRVAIARAILKDAPILVLDEATSALDSESEVLIQAALWELMKNRTAIVIAHRLSTIQKMDRIIVLEDGKITEEGTHKELLKKNGTYAKLWAHQSGGFIEE